MFGDLQGMMKRLKETRKRIEETKTRLETVIIDETHAQGMITVSVTASGKVRSIDIDPELTDRDELQDYLVLTLNKALDRATELRERELAIAAKDGLPDIPGLDQFM
jgi:DNA-binding YbaB/EbfC family protein